MLDILTLREAAKILKVSYRTMQRLVQKRALPVFKVGGQWRINKEDLNNFVTQSQHHNYPGKDPYYFRIRVLDRYKSDPKYTFEEDNYRGHIALRKEFLPYDKPELFIFAAAMLDVPFQKMELKDGTPAVVMGSFEYERTIGSSINEDKHWQNYRIWRPELDRIATLPPRSPVK